MRQTGRAALGLGLVFAWVLLVPLGPAGGVPSSWVSAVAVAHGVGLALAGWLLARRALPLRALSAAFCVAALAHALLPVAREAALILAAVLAAVPVLACGGSLARLSARERAWAVGSGAALANFPLLLLHSDTAPLALRLGAVIGSLAAFAGAELVRPTVEPRVGRLPWRLVAAVGATYLVGGVTYGLVLPSLGGSGLGVVPYLFLLALAAWLANQVGRSTTVRLGLAALGCGALGWGLGWSSLHPYLAALLVGCWAFLDVGWWSRLGDETGWTTSYAIGLGAMAGAIGIGLFVTPLLGGVDPLSGAALALAALLGAALLLPGEASMPRSGLPVLEDPVAQDGEVPARVAETAVPAAPVRLSSRERRILELVARGASNKEIAQELGIREGTVRTHLERLYRKLGVRSRTEAAAWYWRTVARSDEPRGAAGDPTER